MRVIGVVRKTANIQYGGHSHWKHAIALLRFLQHYLQQKIAFCRMKHCYDKETISAHKTRICILLHKALNLNGADSELCSLSLA